MLRYLAVSFVCAALCGCYGNLEPMAQVGDDPSPVTSGPGDVPNGKPPAPKPTSFVTSRNGHLMLEDKALTMVGYQVELPDISPCGVTGAQFEAGLDRIATQGEVNTVRMWLFQWVGGPGNWATFDKALAAAERRGLKVIPTLVNQWGDCEPDVAGKRNYKTLAWYQQGYRETQDGYTLAYRDYARAVAEHYANSPTILFWQLVNEAEVRDPDHNLSCPDERAASLALRAFTDDMTQLLHDADPHHLVNLGTSSQSNCGLVDDDYRMVHAGKVDICEVHSYDPAPDKLPAIVRQRIEQCRALAKPNFMGEVGICRNVQLDGTCQGPVTSATLAQRARFLDGKAQASLAAGLDGVLVWKWSANRQDNVFGVMDGDPLEGVLK